MSELVEKVARAIAKAYHETCRKDDPDAEAELSWDMWEPEARAAIAVVAEWLAQSEDRECNPLQCLSAALRQAAGGEG